VTVLLIYHLLYTSWRSGTPILPWRIYRSGFMKIARLLRLGAPITLSEMVINWAPDGQASGGRITPPTAGYVITCRSPMRLPTIRYWMEGRNGLQPLTCVNSPPFGIVPLISCVIPSIQYLILKEAGRQFQSTYLRSSSVHPSLAVFRRLASMELFSYRLASYSATASFNIRFTC
jgi:hypothetical protein